MLVALSAVVTGCGGGADQAGGDGSTTSRLSATIPPRSVAKPRRTLASEPPPCGRAVPPPARYDHVVVIMEENRTWPLVGGVGFAAMPFVAGLARQCTVYDEWLETNPNQSSLTQYIGLTSGIDNPATVEDCDPSASCRSTDANIFRQVREAGGSARTFVEGPSAGCSAKGNAPKHVPALYYFGGDDHRSCSAEVRPLAELDPDRLPTFAMVVPDLCHDGHDCDNNAVDAWLADHLGAILAGASYRSGTTAVFLLYDEDRPAPNLIIAPTAKAGVVSESGAGHRAALATFAELLGLPILPSVATAGSLRRSANI